MRARESDLSLVLELVKMHGGAVQVNSVEGQGSTFTVLHPDRPRSSAEGTPFRNALAQCRRDLTRRLLSKKRCVGRRVTPLLPARIEEDL